MPPSRYNSKRQKGSRRSIDTVGTAAGQALRVPGGEVRHRRLLADGKVDRGRDAADTEQPAALGGLAVIVVAGTGVTMARSVLVDVVRSNFLVIVGQAMGRYGGIAEGQHGRWRRQAECVKRDKKTCRAPTPPTG